MAKWEAYIYITAVNSAISSKRCYGFGTFVSLDHLLGGRNAALSTNIPLRRDSLPMAHYKVPADKGVAVYFTYKNRQMCFACDAWDKIEDHMQAVWKTIEGLRGIARWGTGDMTLTPQRLSPLSVEAPPRVPEGCNRPMTTVPDV
jgi:hypothetical protein